MGTVMLNSDCGILVNLPSEGSMSSALAMPSTAESFSPWQQHSDKPIAVPQAKRSLSHGLRKFGQGPQLGSLRPLSCRPCHPHSLLQVQSADRFLSCKLKEGKQPPSHQLLQESCRRQGYDGSKEAKSNS